MDQFLWPIYVNEFKLPFIEGCSETCNFHIELHLLLKLDVIEVFSLAFRLAEFQGDIIAGFTVGLTVIPQSIAYASIAGVPAEVRLLNYSVIIIFILSTAC